jgi:hypothetical protein
VPARIRSTEISDQPAAASASAAASRIGLERSNLPIPEPGQPNTPPNRSWSLNSKDRATRCGKDAGILARLNSRTGSRT